MNLLGVELRRLWERRLPRVLVAAVMLVLVVAGTVTFFTHRSEPVDTTDALAGVEQEVMFCRDQAIIEWEDFEATGTSYDEEYADYLAEFDSAEAFADEQCRPEYFGYYIEEPRYCLISLYEREPRYSNACPDALPQDGEPIGEMGSGRDDPMRPPYPGAQGVVPGVSLVLLGLAAVLGASFIGAEYAEGTIETTLLWDTRRRRVLAAKLMAVAIGAAVIHLVVVTWLVVVMLPAGLWRGSTAGVDASFWWGLSGTAARGAGVAAVYAVIAASVATVARNTAGGVAALLGYVAVSPILTVTVLTWLRPRDLVVNSMATVNGGEVSGLVAVTADGSSYLSEVFSHGTGLAALHVAIYLVLFVVMAIGVFVRRDVD